MASVSVTVLPEMAGAVLLSAAVASVPPRVRSTVKAELASEAAAARSSEKVMTSDVPSTVAEANVGAVVSLPLLVVPAIRSLYSTPDVLKFPVSPEVRRWLPFAMVQPEAGVPSSLLVLVNTQSTFGASVDDHPVVRRCGPARRCQ